MSDTALTRYRLYRGDVAHDLYPIAESIEHSPQDLCLADDAAREIERLEKLSVEREAAVWGEVDDKMVEIERLEARLAQVQEALKQIARDGCRMPWAIACTRTNGGEQWCEGCIAELALHELERSGV